MKDDLEILKILKTVWSQRKIILIITTLFVVLGIVDALLAPREYKVNTTMILQTGSASGGRGQGLEGLAALAGISSGNQSFDEIPPTLYPQIVSATPFQLDMLKTMITTSKVNAPITLREYQSDFGGTLGFMATIKKYTIGLPAMIARSSKKSTNEVALIEAEPSDSLFRISVEDKALLGALTEVLELSVDQENGIVTLSIVMPEAIAAAQVATNARRLLQGAITSFKIKKAKDQLEFTNALYNQRKSEFLALQSALAKFRDKNLNISTARAKNEEERLEADYALAQTIYGEIARQLETMKIKVQENTPSFTVLEPVIVPLQPSGPKRKIMVLTALLLGLVFGIGFVLSKKQYLILKQRWHNS